MTTLSDSLFRALGWALVHSIWQGALAALVLLILLPRLQTARQRYRASYSALTAVFVTAVGTFIWAYQPAEAIVAPQFSGSDANSMVHFFVENQSATWSPWEFAAQWLEANSAFVATIWFTGFAFFLLRLLGGLWQLRRLKTRGLTALESIWQEKLLLLGSSVGIRRAVGLFESALVHAPLTIGWLKPVILLPVGLLNQLSSAEVEAVLAHELAHIARRDWVFNLFQAFVESIFYYHPAVWWVSQVIRRERENCCDDVAITATGNPLAFARALVQVQEMATPSPVLALAMSGKRSPLLLERVRRILNQPTQQKSQIMEKFVATAILVGVLALVGLRANTTTSLTEALAQVTEIPALLFGAQEGENDAESDSLPRPKQIQKIIREEDDKRVEAEYQNGQLTRLNIDGKEIPASEFGQHEELLEEMAEAPEMRGMPPMPPMPPMPDMAPMPDMPPMPDMRGMRMTFAPPMPPPPPSPPQIMRLKDEDGNTIIRLGNGASISEIKMKDGKVWLDGKELGEGESKALEGMMDREERVILVAPEDGDRDEVRTYTYTFGDDDRNAPADRQMRREVEIVKEQQEIMEMDRKQHEKGQKAQAREQKRWQKEQKEWAKEQEKWAKDQEKWARDQQHWAQQQEVMMVEKNAENGFSKAFKERLVQDGLIKDPRNFKVMLNAKEFRVNGEKQSDALHRQYLEFYKARTGKELGPDASLMWSEND